MNIPENILQQVADAAFLSSNGGMMGLLTCNKEKNHVFWHEERYERRAVIQHALSNPALAPFLSRGIGEYTDEEIKAAAMDTYTTYGIVINSTWLRSFLAALPAAEDTPPAEPAADATTIAKCAINNTEQNVQFRATAGYGTWGAAVTVEEA